MRRFLQISAIIFFITSCLNATDEKFILKPNRTITYKQLPGVVNNFSAMFSQGMFYGRIRSNNFYFDWKTAIPNKTKDNYEIGLGGSIAYKSAIYKNFSVEATFYGSESLLHMDRSDIAYIKSGKDLFSRYEAYVSGNWNLYSLAIANIAYTFNHTTLRVGRVVFNTLLTNSNDTKMIPNTFEGVILTSKDIPHSILKLGYLTRQKLRNHATFHDVITYAKDLDGSGDLNLKQEAWANNDDSASHRGLNYFTLKANHKNINNSLLVAQLETKLQNYSILVNYTAIPQLFSIASIEGKYGFILDNMKLIPAFRFMHQFDNGAGKIAGASLSTNTTGYTDPNSLESDLFAIKLDAKFSKHFKIRVAYSQVADKADIIAPWRGFPTGGYTRAMGQYNWIANTKTYLARIDYNFLNGWYVMGRYAYQNFDEKKKTVMTDSNVYNLDIVYQPKFLRGFDTKLRIGYVDAKKYVTKNYSPSYTDYRLEFNYLF